MKKKAQASMEMLILMGFLTFVIVGILGIGYFYSSTINDRIKSSQVGNFANKIISTSESVFYAGEPSKSTISVNLPDSIQDIGIEQDALVIEFTLSSGTNILAFPSSVPIVESISSPITTSSGIKNIEISANQTHAIISQK